MQVKREDLVEPVSGFEPLTCRLQEVRPGAQRALAAPMAHVIALTAPAVLGLSSAPFHEPFHADGGQRPMAVTERSDQKPTQRSRNLTTWSDRTVEQVIALPNRAAFGTRRRRGAASQPGPARAGLRP